METQVGSRNMAKRAERLGAQFSFHFAPGQSTSIVLTLPAVIAAPVTAPAQQRSA